MYGREAYRMTPFQRGLYRHHVNAQRNFDKKHGRIDRLTRISPDKDDPAKSTEQVVEIDRTWPLNIAGIARILRLHTLHNRGEGRMQALRLIVEIDDNGEKGVMAATVDLLYGIVEFRFRYKRWGGAEVGPRALRIADLLRPDEQPTVLALYRLCELLDADEKLGLGGFYRAFIAEALAHPDGLGFPKFTKDPGRDLLGLLNAAEGATRSGIQDGMQDGAWYARTCTPFSRDPLDIIRVFVGQAYTLHRSLDDWKFREGGISAMVENAGYGRIVPTHEFLIYDPWLSPGHKLIRLEAPLLEAVRAHVERPFHGTSKLMAECLKTV